MHGKMVRITIVRGVLLELQVGSVPELFQLTPAIILHETCTLDIFQPPKHLVPQVWNHVSKTLNNTFRVSNNIFEVSS